METVGCEERGAIPEQKKVMDVMEVGGMAGGLKPVMERHQSAKVRVAARQCAEWARDEH